MATTHLTSPQSGALIPHHTGQLRKAWTLLGYLLTIGSPARPAELAARCGVLKLSPDQVEYLCSIPGSPLRLTEDRFVTYALDSCYAFARFPGESSRFDFGSILRRMGSEWIGRTIGGFSWTLDCEFESRKRKGNDLLTIEFMPAKRRASLTNCNDDEVDIKALTLRVLVTSKESSQISLMLKKGSNDSHSYFKRDRISTPRGIQAIQPEADNHGFHKTHIVSSKKLKTSNKRKLSSELQNFSIPSRKSLPRNADTVQQTAKKDILDITLHNSLKETDYADGHIDQTKINSDSKTHTDKNKFPNFESFIVEEEEGSGGYGTVYKARRKNDNEVLAIKCPHPNAHRHHVNNELSMLQRFGGKNFVIKLEDSFKHGDSRCFVLQHVEHDRPEVLKREIDVSQLRWYTYCMFEALASLHKHGTVHRDIKPGNFLFSQLVNIGYLIDFNLAMDLHQKSRPLNRLKMVSDATDVRAPLQGATNVPTKSSKLINTKNKGSDVRAIERKGTADSKNVKAAASRTKPSSSMCNKQILHQSHVALDGSGVTSTKDITSSKTPADRMRQPMPYIARKEILKLALEAMQSPRHEALRLPASKSKRISAAPEKIDRKLLNFSPMPLHSSGVAVAGAGAGLLGHKGDEKKQKEGPCAGTKGFRAPEVLFRSAHQGPKVDVWSAGVTLLYLMIGKAPFYGDPIQNIKDIAKLRGSEDLWEVAKLHNQESAFPVELFDVKYLPSMKLKDWCQLHSKRPSFIKEIPDVLFDFVDKCLTVNPRTRMSAEEALKHEFLTPCHDLLREHSLLSSTII
ncbi:unnamed protein product [Rhodiola kirilowii]